MDVNVVAVSGRVTRDPELRASASGTPVLSFCVASNERRKFGAEWRDVPNYVRCTVFGPRADSLGRLLAKGRQVFVTGRLRYSSWEGAGGERHSSLDVVVSDLSLGAVPGALGQRQADAAPAAEACDPASVYDDEIPF